MGRWGIYAGLRFFHGKIVPSELIIRLKNGFSGDNFRSIVELKRAHLWIRLLNGFLKPKRCLDVFWIRFGVCSTSINAKFLFGFLYFVEILSI